MTEDREQLNLIAAVLCCIGGAASVAAAYWAGGARNPGGRAAILSGLFGMIGSAAWALAAYQDKAEADARRAADT